MYKMSVMRHNNFFLERLLLYYKQPPFLFCAGLVLLPVRCFTPAMWPAHISMRRSWTNEVGPKWWLFGNPSVLFTSKVPFKKFFWWWPFCWYSECQLWFNRLLKCLDRRELNEVCKRVDLTFISMAITEGVKPVLTQNSG